MEYKIKEPFSERYTLMIESNMKAVNASMISKVEIRWDFRVITVDEYKLEIELLLLDHTLLESNNPLLKEIASMNEVFGRMYKELHLIIDYKGQILEVLNMDLILSKWTQTKKEMQTIADKNDDIKNIISLNDSLFQNPEKLIKGIQGSEFFMVYFNHQYAHALPYNKTGILKNNFFNSVNVSWLYRVGNQNPNAKHDDTVSIIKVNAQPDTLLDKDFINKAYSQFGEQMDLNECKPEIIENGIYVIENKNGKLLEVVLERNEMASADTLYTKMKYTLKADSLANMVATTNIRAT